MKALSFNGSGGEYFKIWIVNILLTIITLGLYYPWAKVRNNRYFYANSELEQRSFDYHATGKQLFFGYLIAMGILIVYLVIQAVSPIGSLLVILGLFLGFPWILWQSLKFNMRMTSFSNVRFGFEGGVGQAYINYMLLPIGLIIAIYALPTAIIMAVVSSEETISPLLASFIVIGGLLFFPMIIFMMAFIKKRNTHYSLGNIKYGQGEFSTKVETRGFAKILLKTLGLGILLIVVFMVVLALASMFSGVGDQLLQLSGSLDDPEAMDGAFDGAVFGTIAVAYLGFIVVSMLLFAYSYSRQRKYVFDNTKLDHKIAFKSTLKARPLAWVTVTNFLAVIFSLALALPWAKVRMTRLILENSWVDTDIGFDDYVTQQQDQQSSLGEQIGDAFDLDVGIGI